MIKARRKGLCNFEFGVFFFILSLSLLVISCRKNKKQAAQSVERPWKTIFYKNGKRYEGEVNHKTDSIPNGFGVMFYRTDSTYYGNWSDGIKSGIGRMEYKDGTFVYGRWNNGTLACPPDMDYSWGDKVYGIDLSKYQPKIWWHMLTLYCDRHGTVFSKKAKETTYVQPVMFIILKSTEGATHVDGKYKQYVEVANRHRLVKGSYHFLTVTSDIQAQIDNYIAHTEYEAGDIPPILDIEIPEDQLRGNNLFKMQDYALTWLAAIEQHYHVRPMIYASENFREKYLYDAVFDKYDFWVARYYGVKPSNAKWRLWQFTDRGQLSGMRSRHNIDINIFNGTYADFKKWLKISNE